MRLCLKRSCIWKAICNRQPATSNKQPATSNKQPATSNQQPATSNNLTNCSLPTPSNSSLYKITHQVTDQFAARWICSSISQAGGAFANMKVGRLCIKSGERNKLAGM